MPRRCPPLLERRRHVRRGGGLHAQEAVKGRAEALKGDVARLERELAVVTAAAEMVDAADGGASGASGTPPHGKAQPGASAAMATMRAVMDARVRDLQNRNDYLRAQLQSELTCKVRRRDATLGPRSVDAYSWPRTKWRRTSRA